MNTIMFVLDYIKKGRIINLTILKIRLSFLRLKRRFIEYVIEEKVVVYKVSKSKIIEKLREFEFPFYIDNTVLEYDNTVEVKSEYNYLLNLPIFNFTLEKVEELDDDITDKKEKHNTLENTDIKDIWRNELDIFEEKYNEWLHVF